MGRRPDSRCTPSTAPFLSCVDRSIAASTPSSICCLAPTRKTSRNSATSVAVLKAITDNKLNLLLIAAPLSWMPAVLDLALYGTLAARPPAIDRLSLCSAFVLMIAYAGSLIYSLTSQRDLFRTSHEGEHDGQAMPRGAAVSLLGIGTLLTTIEAEILVGALQPALAQFGFTELFVGVIVIAIIGNA